MISAGIDLGGTKIETQVFDEAWARLGRRRRETPRDYGALVEAVAGEVAWAEGEGAGAVGIAAAGLVNPRTGLALTANLAATGHPFPADIARAAGRPVLYVNDCRALTLSEAVLGAARGLTPVAGLILGTGIGGGLAVDGRLVPGPSGTGGEFGHTAAPAHVVHALGLPVVPCGCGRTGCLETLIAGPGLMRLARRFGAAAESPEALAAARGTDAGARRAWEAWCALMGELVITLAHVADPAAVVLGGGLSRIPGVAEDVEAAARAAALPGFAVPRVLLAEGGDASGARGAALAARAEALAEAGHG
jgi:N-acetylglucosamine kinase